MMTATTILTLILTQAWLASTPSERPATPQNAEALPLAVAILTKADEATKAVESVRYRAHATGTGWLQERIPEVEGTAIIAGEHEVQFRLARFDTQVRFPSADHVQKLTYGADGTHYYLIDWEAKLFYEDADRRVTGRAGRVAQQIGLREFVHPTPFDDEIHGDLVRLVDRANVDREPCYVIDVEYANNGGHAVWYISRRDYLPRRVDRVQQDRDGNVGAFVVEIYDLEVNPTIDAEQFKLSPPEDFETSARFAPDRAGRSIPW